MGATRVVGRTLRYAAVFLLPILVSCSSDDEPTGNNANPLVGTWHVTSFQALGSDFVQEGMSLTFTINEGGTYSLAVTGDAVGACDTGTSCTNTGTWSSTTTTFTLDPGTQDAVTFNYSISGNTMTWTGSIDGNAATIVSTRG